MSAYWWLERQRAITLATKGTNAKGVAFDDVSVFDRK